MKPNFSIFLLLLTFCASAQSGTHPLDPLDTQEIETAMRVLHNARKIQRDSVIPMIALHEPDKQEVLKGRTPPREALAVVYDRSKNATYEAVIGLDGARLLSFTQIPGAQPAILGEDSYLADQIIRSNPSWQAAMRKRGIVNPVENVAIDFWSTGFFGLPEDTGTRMVKGISYLRGLGDNYYAHPIEGIVAYVDLTAKKVMKLVDTGVVPIPKETADYQRNAASRLREATKPLRITQPNGPSFQLVDGEVRWQKWRFRFSMHPREGLILYLVRYADGGRDRSILYRASLSEMTVPYGDPGVAWFFRNSFDAGELGMGSVASSLRPGLDCPENSTLLDAVMADDRGTPRRLPHAVALYERDGGIAWKHGDETRRARDLVLSYISTVGNYDYTFNWIFHQDGAIEMKTGLTGIMSVKAVNPDEPGHGAHGHLVAKGISAVHHQHFFNFRLDLDLDGADGNQAVEMNTAAMPAGKENPYGGGFVMNETLLRTETQAMRAMDLQSSRRWKIINSTVRNALGQPVGYTLLPGENAVPFAAPDSWIRRRAGFLNFPFWVTPYKSNELYAAGTYPNQSKGGEGLAKWTTANRSIEGKDLVVWYTMGITHNPRPEDWPVMPVHEAGFKLVPTGFFTRNPALDLP